MAYNGTGNKIVAIVPARGGSKGIPKKNLVPLKGKPLIAYAIEVGLACKEVDRVIVSTDDPEIARIASDFGGEVPFIRPENIAQDDTPDKPVFLHLIEWLKENEKFEFDYLVNLRCTTPLKQVEHIKKAIRLIKNEDCDSVRTVDKIAGKYHPYWIFKTDRQGFGTPFIDRVDLTTYYQRQLLPPAYSINALVDVMKTEVLLGHDYTYGTRIKLLETDPIYSLDIDSIKDLLVCEAIMEKINELV
ncbi:MAG: acylneuraminate cytidylyltransferase family protein [Nitrospinaceae bacterium]|jgi:CMP-N-acetylneuraminic acid synthetase|nr:acylneuraminate cytidylyltransferase family protein [Nitrospinaceae bacterium]|tara:strand:- start:237 stop:971 length:735 start_codon:yes stop_codon:yes gene_type:complete